MTDRNDIHPPDTAIPDTVTIGCVSPAPDGAPRLADLRYSEQVRLCRLAEPRYRGIRTDS